MSEQSTPCSALSSSAGEPLAGSAPRATGWLVVEHPGPWGRDALAGPTIPEEFTAFAEHLLREYGIRTLLARHQTRRRLSDSDPRNVWLALSESTHRSLRHTWARSLSQVGNWNPSAISLGELPNSTKPPIGQLELICTHSGRDACCALHGRARAAQRPWAWECSHLGGHRFAATSLVLPNAMLFGRLEATSDDDLGARNLRGASFLPPMLQVADAAVREFADMNVAEPLTLNVVSEEPAEALVRVEDRATRIWDVACQMQEFMRAASCSKDPEVTAAWVVASVTERQN